MEILTELRAATGPIHQRIEELPASKAMLAGEIDRAAYAQLLVNLYHLHAAFEVEHAATPEVAAVWPQTPSRAAALARDLQAFDVDPGEAPMWVADWIAEMHSCAHPAAWAGAGYVFEGSRMGSRILARSLSRGLGLEMRLGVGLDYHLDAGEDPMGNWKRVMAALAALDRDPAARTAMLTAAVRTFEMLYTLHEAVRESSSAFAVVG
jgi:heme oxygenase